MKRKSKVGRMRRGILQLIKTHGVLNRYEICRLMNQFGKEEYGRCYYTFKEKPLGSAPPDHKPCKSFEECFPNVSQVSSALKGMKLRSRKMRFFDKGGIGSDLFRFFFVDSKVFERKILKQTLMGYSGKRILPQTDMMEFMKKRRR